MTIDLRRRSSRKPKRKYGRKNEMNRTPKGFYTHGKRGINELSTR